MNQTLIFLTALTVYNSITYGLLQNFYNTYHLGAVSLPSFAVHWCWQVPLLYASSFLPLHGFEQWYVWCMMSMPIVYVIDMIGIQVCSLPYPWLQAVARLAAALAALLLMGMGLALASFVVVALRYV